MQNRPIPRDGVLLWNTYRRSLYTPQEDPNLYETTTVAGRPIRLLGAHREALNHQNQGTGADILATAISSLPTEIAEMLLIPVHDELVFEVPAADIEVVKRIVIETMTRAGEDVLKGAVPIAVEASVGETWE